MIEVKREDFFVESIKNPIEYGTYYKINQKYGIGFQWTSEVHHDFVITVTDIRFNQETVVGEGGSAMSAEVMTIRQMCDAFDVTPRTLRFYETRELLFPQRRGQHRLYGRSDRARLKLILRGKRFGFSLEQIRQLLELYDPAERNVTQTEATLSTARERLADMERQYAELGAAIAELRAQITDGEAQLKKLKTNI